MSDKRKYTRFVYPEDIENINPKNIDLLDKFIMGKRNLSDTSRKAYINDFQSFFVYILKNHQNKYLFDFEVEEAAEMIDDYISFCMSVLGNSERRVSRRTSSISSLYIFYKKRRKIKENPVDLLERVRAANGQYVADHVFLTAEQVELIREKIQQNPDVQLELYFELSLYTMARISAVCSIRLDQINLERKVITGVKEKEGYIVDLFISDKVKGLIAKWIDERKLNNIESDLLFCTRNGTDAKSTIQSSYVKKLSGYAGVRGVTAHCLRRTGSSLRRKAGMALEDISKLLNHRSTAVTQQFYIEEDFAKLQDEAEKFDI